MLSKNIINIQRKLFKYLIYYYYLTFYKYYKLI